VGSQDDVHCRNVILKSCSKHFACAVLHARVGLMV
jgi:hypothetical protein